MNNYLENPRNRWTVLWILCGSLVIVVVSVSSLNVAIPEIQRSLGATGSELQWIVDSYAVVFAGLLLPAGALGDRYGRKGALLVGLAVLGASSVGGMWASGPAELIIWRGLMGAGAALIMPATLSIVTTVFPEDERPKAIAIWAGFAGAGGVVGLLSSGVLLEAFWWGSIFLVNVPLVVIMVFAVGRFVPTSRDGDQTPMDPIGGVVSTVGLVALVFGIIEGPEAGWTSALVLGSFVVAIVALTLFVSWELRSEHPLLDPRFFKIRAFTIGSLVITLAFFGLFGMFFVLTQYFQFVQGLSALETGIRILPYALVLLLVSPSSARLAAKHGERDVMTVGLVVAAGGFVLLAFANPGSLYLMIGVALVLIAAGTGLLMPPATTALVVALPPEKAGVGSAVNDTTREVGGAIGIAIVGVLTSVGYRRSLGDAADELGEHAAEAGRDSIGALLLATHELPSETVAPVIETAREAFTDGMFFGMGLAAMTLAAAAVMVRALLEGPGETRASDADTDQGVSA